MRFIIDELLSIQLLLLLARVSRSEKTVAHQGFHLGLLSRYLIVLNCAISSWLSWIRSTW
jgi:hypothetical protein